AEDEVTVETERGNELLDQLNVNDEDRPQQWREARGQVGAGQSEREDRVEVDAAEIGTHAPGLGEPVGVGDVRVEGRPDDVDAHADDSRAGAAVRAGRRMAAL